jgi:hypothetical protein
MPAQRIRLPMILRLAGWAVLLSAGWLLSTDRSAADESATPEPSAASEEVLVLRTGTIVSGKIVRSGKLYEVQGANGSKWAVPDDLVKIRCASLSEAYQKLRESAQKQHDANAHIALARWCLTNHLEKEAVQESHDALKLEPDREDAKRLLRNAEESLKPEAKPTARVEDKPLSRIVQVAASTTDDAVSLGGLSREQALQFSRRIQPLLLNNCTAAGCHGRDAQTSFRLYKMTPGKDANRHAAERNLAEVFECINVNRPRSSPLLTAPRGKHGRRGKPIFAGPRGEEQFAELEKWVVSVARSRRGEQEENGAITGSRSSGTRQDAGATGVRNVTPASIPMSSGGLNGSLPAQPPLPAGRGDPFEPSAFNKETERRSGR